MPALESSIEEEFARAVAGGMKVGAAYAAGHPNASKKTCSENGSKLAKSTKVKPRIIEIRQISAKIGEKATKKAVENAAKKLGTALLTMQRRRELIAERANRKGVSDSALVSLLNLDAKLAGELIEKTDLVTDGQALPAAMPQIIVAVPGSFATRRIGASRN